MISHTDRELDSSPYLAGRKVRSLNARFVVGLLVGVPIVVALLGSDSMHDPFRIVVLTFLCSVGAIVLVARRWTAGVRLVNDGLVALHDNRVDRAVELFRDAATRWHFVNVTGIGLYDLGVVALRRGDIVDAIALFRSAHEKLRGAGSFAQKKTYGDLARAKLAFALACAGELKKAERWLAEPGDPNADPNAAASLVCAKALVAFRNGRWVEVVDLLDGERRLLRNVLVGHDAPLAEAMEAAAFAKLGGVHPRVGQPATPVFVDDDDRAYIVRIVPDAEGCLATA